MLTTALYGLLGFAVLGFVVYLIVTYIPMPAIFKQIIIAAAAILAVLALIDLATGHSLGFG